MASVVLVLVPLLVLAGAGVWVTGELRKVGRCRDEYYPAHLAIAQSPDPVMWVDAVTLQINGANPAFLRRFRYSAAELRGRVASELFLQQPPTVPGADLWRNPPEHEPLTACHRDQAGHLIEVELLGHRVELPETCALLYTCRERPLRARLEANLLEKQQHLDRLAHHDPLTGLPNRLFLAAHLPGALEEAARSGRMLAVLFLDLDRFKHINDSRGHETGDQLLKAVAQRLRAAVSSDDITIRMGGDEFVVILKSVVDVDDVARVIVDIQQSLARPIVVSGISLMATASIGASLFPRDGADMGELLRHSDTAMYQAKERGRNNYQLFSPLMERRLKSRIAIETQLRQALTTDQLTVYYQPIVEIGTNQVVALEALLRWMHPVHGRIAPAHFITIAEESGLIVPVGEFVLERALTDARRWRTQGCAAVPIAVNVSAAQLQRSNLAQVIAGLAQRLKIDPSILQVELTEGTMFQRRENRNGESNADAVTQLRDLGIQISIDDFGTGYSSLSYLKRWPVDSLKIDKSFTRDLGSDPSDLAIVGAIIAMARNLNIAVIAEGIEGWQQLERLRHLGCARAQGHLFAKPTAAEHCERFLHGVPLDLTLETGRSDPRMGATGLLPRLVH